MQVPKPGLLEPVASFHQKNLAFICQTMAEAGYEVFIVGGCVRDLLLGKIPDEFDLTTNARPETVAGLFKKVIPTGIEHGTVTVLLGREPYEITTYRSETSYTDGRRPDSIQYEDNLEADVARRDFTINGLAYDFVKEEVYDYTSGLVDLERGVIKAIGDPIERFTEDGLRSVRACRFVVKLGFRIDDATWEAIPTTLKISEKVAVERFYDEWGKAMSYPEWPKFFDLLHESGLLEIFLKPKDMTNLLSPASKIQLGPVKWPDPSPQVWSQFNRRGIISALDLEPSDLDTYVIFKQALEACSYAALYAGYIADAECENLGDPNLAKVLEFLRSRSNKTASLFFNINKRPHLVRDLFFSLKGFVELAAQFVWQDSPYHGRLLSHYAATAPGSLYLSKLLPYFTVGLKAAGFKIPATKLATEAITLKELAISGADIMKHFAIKGPAVGLALNFVLGEVLISPDLNKNETLLELLTANQSSWHK